MDSCFLLVRTHHPERERAELKVQHILCPKTAEESAKHSFERQLHIVNVVAVASTVQDSRHVNQLII